MSALTRTTDAQVNLQEQFDRHRKSEELNKQTERSASGDALLGMVASVIGPNVAIASLVAFSFWLQR